MADILFVLVRGATLEAYGGEKSSIATARGLQARGLNLRFLTTRDDGFTRELAEAGIPFDIVPMADPFSDFRAASLANRARRMWDVARLNLAVFRVRAPIVHTVATTGFLGGFLGGRVGGAKVIYHVRGASPGRKVRLQEELAILCAHRTITVSESLRDQLTETGHARLRTRLRRRVEAIYNGFDFDEIDAYMAAVPRPEARRRCGLTDDPFEILHVGGICPDKGQLAFIERVFPSVAAAIPGIHLTLVGGIKDPSYAAACRAALIRTGLDTQVTWTGYLTKREVFQRYRAADLLLLPSEREGLPRAAIEAQAFGVPVVGTAIVGTIEAVVDGETGLLVEIDRIEGLLPAIVRLAQDTETRVRMGQAGAVRVRRLFSLERNVSAIAELYQRLQRRQQDRSLAT